MRKLRQIAVNINIPFQLLRTKQGKYRGSGSKGRAGGSGREAGRDGQHQIGGGRDAEGQNKANSKGKISLNKG